MLATLVGMRENQATWLILRPMNTVRMNVVQRRTFFSASLFTKLLLWALLGLGLMVAQAWNPDLMRKSADLYGPTASRLTLDLQDMIQESSGLSEDRRVLKVNTFINTRLRQEIDKTVWGLDDYWASPMEFFSKDRGDCEDFAIAKYYSLVALNLPVEKLRLVYVMFTPSLGELQQAHLVLAYYRSPDEEPYILDNLTDEVRLASYRPDLEPMFSFNGVGLWWGTQGADAGNPLARLSPWRQVVVKAKNQGFTN